MMASMTSSMASVTPPASSAGRSKTDQVVLECLYKAAEVIIQSRINFNPTRVNRNRRARFNLDVDEIDNVRQFMYMWKENPHAPLVIYIYWDESETSNLGQVSKNANERQDRELLERWVIHYSPYVDYEGSSADVIAQLRLVCKRIGVFLRTLFSYVRLLPAYSLFRKCQGTSSTSCLGYMIGSTDEDINNISFQYNHQLQRLEQSSPPRLEFPPDISTSRFCFSPIETPFGILKISTLYRRDCSLQLRTPSDSDAQQPIMMTNCIIQDYVPSEERPKESPPKSSDRNFSTSAPPAVTSESNPLNSEYSSPLRRDRRRTSSLSTPMNFSQNSHSSTEETVNVEIATPSKFRETNRMEYCGGSSPVNIPVRTKDSKISQESSGSTTSDRYSSPEGRRSSTRVSPPRTTTGILNHRESSELHDDRPHARSFDEISVDRYNNESTPTETTTAAPFGYRNLKIPHSHSHRNSEEIKWGIGTPPFSAPRHTGRSNFVPPRHPNTRSKTVLTQEESVGTAAISTPPKSRGLLESSSNSSPNGMSIMDRHRKQRQPRKEITNHEKGDREQKVIPYANSQKVPTEIGYSSSVASTVSSTPPQASPPFSFSSSLNRPSPFSLELPVFGTSPPFSSNPSHLISSSPQSLPKHGVLMDHPSTADKFQDFLKNSRSSATGRFSNSVDLWGVEGVKYSGSSVADLQRISRRRRNQRKEEESIDPDDELEDLPFALGFDRESKFQSRLENLENEKELTENKNSSFLSLGNFIEDLKAAPSLRCFKPVQTNVHLMEDDFFFYKGMREELISKFSPKDR